MTPSAVLVIKDGATKLVNIKNQDSMTKILDMVRISSISYLRFRYRSAESETEE